MENNSIREHVNSLQIEHTYYEEIFILCNCNCNSNNIWQSKRKNEERKKLKTSTRMVNTSNIRNSKHLTCHWQFFSCNWNCDINQLLNSLYILTELNNTVWSNFILIYFPFLVVKCKNVNDDSKSFVQPVVYTFRFVWINRKKFRNEENTDFEWKLNQCTLSNVRLLSAQ